jgi:hypothetical protein
VWLPPGFWGLGGAVAFRGGRKVLGDLLAASWPPGGCGSLLGGLHERGRNPGWPLGAWWASWALREPPGRRARGGWSRGNLVALLWPVGASRVDSARGRRVLGGRLGAW